jgi:hypothetical protein
LLQIFLVTAFGNWLIAAARNARRPVVHGVLSRIPDAQSTIRANENRAPALQHGLAT